MVKNKFGGNRAKGMKRQVEEKKIMTVLDDPSEQWGLISGKSLGGNRFLVKCEDGVIRLGVMRNYVKRGTRLDDGTFVVVSPWDFEKKTDDKKQKCSIIALGNPNEAIKQKFKVAEADYNPNDIVDFDDDFGEDDVFDFKSL